MCLSVFIFLNWGNNMVNVFIHRNLKEQVVFVVGYCYENTPGVVNCSPIVSKQQNIHAIYVCFYFS